METKPMWKNISALGYNISDHEWRGVFPLYFENYFCEGIWLKLCVMSWWCHPDVIKLKLTGGNRQSMAIVQSFTATSRLWCSCPACLACARVRGEAAQEWRSSPVQLAWHGTTWLTVQQRRSMLPWLPAAELRRRKHGPSTKPLRTLKRSPGYGEPHHETDGGVDFFTER
jgi:hypothetical protein